MNCLILIDYFVIPMIDFYFVKIY